MKKLLAISIVSFLVTFAGCVAGPQDPGSEPSDSVALAGPTTASVAPPGTADGLHASDAQDLALKITRSIRTEQTPCDEDQDPDTSAKPGVAELSVTIRCNRGCIRGCKGLSDSFCASSCCDTTVAP
jgi:hypothetical protein